MKFEVDVDDLKYFQHRLFSALAPKEIRHDEAKVDEWVTKLLEKINVENGNVEGSSRGDEEGT